MLIKYRKYVLAQKYLEIQSKRGKENNGDDCDEEESDEKPSLKKQILKALFQILRRGIQQRGNSDVFKHQIYDEMIMKLTEEGETKSILEEFLSKIN